MKRAIVYGEENYGTEYIMLVGDSDWFPVRYCRLLDPTQVGWGTAFAPSDLYYADLYKQNGSFDDWDGNGNGYYGEIDSVWNENDTFNDINVDNVNLEPDVAVGRVPASSIAEASTYVTKVIAYENGASGEWFHNTLLLTGGYGGYPGDESTFNWIADNCLRSFSKTKYYYNDYQGSMNTRAAQINSYLNEGMGFVSYIGHGGIYEFGQIYHVISHMNNLNNEERLPIIFAAACDTAVFHFMHGEYLDIDGHHPPVTPGHWEHPVPEPHIIQPPLYDQDSCAENFLVKHSNGGVGYIGTGSQGGGLILAKYFAESYDYLSSLTPDIDLPPGEYAFTLKVTDMAGNEAIYPEPLFVEILQEMPERCECRTGEVSRSERGDLNADGRIIREDALIAFTCYMENSKCVGCSDVTCDGKITPLDALCIFNRYMGFASCLDE